MRVVVDIDGVLAEFNTAFHELLQDVGAAMRPLTPGRDPDCWDWPSPYGASADQEARAWQHVVSHPDWWETLDVHGDFSGPHALSDMHLLCQLVDLHEVTFVTHRKNARAHTRQWLLDTFELPLDIQVIACPYGKAGVLVDLDPAVVIEDKPENLMGWLTTCAERGFEGKRGLLVDRPWNRNTLSWRGLTSPVGRPVVIERIPSTPAALKELL